MFPKISIILPTYNGEDYLRQSMDSCLNQTYKNIELIIVDDCSSDRTSEIIHSYNDNRIKYLKQKENIGLPKALNAGFEASCGEYLTWTSDDNYYAPEAITVMTHFLKANPEIDFVYALFYRIDSKGTIIRKEKLASSKKLGLDNCVGGCFLYTRKVYQQIGDYNSQVKLVEDYEYWLRVRKAFKMKKLNKYLYYYRNHENSLSAGWETDKIEKLVDTVRDPFITPAERGYLTLRKAFYQEDYVQAKNILKTCFWGNIFNLEIWRISALLYLNPKMIHKIRDIKTKLTKAKY